MSGRLLPALVIVVTSVGACDSGSPDTQVTVSSPVPTDPVTQPPVTQPPATQPPATSPEPTRPATTVPEPDDEGPPVVLRDDGLGDMLRFGARVDEIIAGLTLRWGPPDEDTGWFPATGGQQPFGENCPGSRVRGVAWGRFYVLFTDGPSPHGPAGKEHFFTWLYFAEDPADPRPDPGGNRPTLRTAAGISVAATVEQLRAAYGERLNLYDETTEEGLATGGPGFSAAGIFGALTSLEPAGKVTKIVGGGGCN